MRAVTDPAAPATIFPGQGSQTPTMRDTVARDAPDLLRQATELVGEDPFARVEDSTAYAQPAIYCASIAMWRRIADRVQPVATAGHSLGELSALAAAGAVDPVDGLRLVVTRGRLMAAAADAAGDGGMIAVLGGTTADAERIADESGVAVANDNAPGQIVLSGPAPALRDATQRARGEGLKTMELGVAGAFHSPAMAGAEAEFAAALGSVAWHTPRVPVVSCVTARPFVDPATELAAALTRPVRWRTTVFALRDAGAQTLVDVGPGRVLARLAKRIDPSFTALVAADLLPDETRASA
jgi:malonyl CoA-acyl carrier protein transacylase